MRQYFAAKALHPDALLLFRMGDFYELFYDDAKIAARELEITLTARDRERQVPMAGVPYHAVEGYLGRLLRKGYRIAICDQMEDPKLTKKIVRREVTRVLSPGTALDPALRSERNNYLAALYIAPAQRGVQSYQDERVGLALLDLSTGEFRATEFQGKFAASLSLDELARQQPAELLLAAESSLFPALPIETIGAALDPIRTKTRLDAWAFSADYAIPLLERQLGARSLDGFGLAGHPAAAIAAGAALHYVRTTQHSDLSHIDGLRYYERTEHLELDAVTVRNLELVEPLFADASPAPRSSTPSTAARRPWANACCAPPFCARCSMRRRSKLASMPSPNFTPHCSRASNFANLSAAFSIWSACSPASRSTPPDPAMCSPSAHRSRDSPSSPPSRALAGSRDGSSRTSASTSSKTCTAPSRNRSSPSRP